MITTPIGSIVVTATDRGIARIDLIDGRTGTERTQGMHPSGGPAPDQPAQAHVLAAEEALAGYFEGARDPFGALVLDPAGTPFQRRVWEGLRTIPPGQTISYRELAARIGQPAAVRAVGLANGRNPLPIVVPCHRVIGADGSLTGFGLGLDVKAWLLVHEGAAAPFATRVTRTTRLRAHPSRDRDGLPLT